MILPQDLNLYQLMKWGNICTIKSGATTNWTLPVFSISCEMEPQQELNYQDYFLQASFVEGGKEFGQLIFNEKGKF